MKIAKGDFIEIDFIARIKATNQIFDLTSEKVAKENNLFDPNFSYGPLVICIGERNVVKGLDDNLIDKEIDKNYTIEVKAEDAFGRKDFKLMKLVPTNIFSKQEIIPVPGLQVNMDGLFGIIRSVTGGRVIVDFNHPLAGHDLIYEIKVNKKITDTSEKLKSCIKFNLGLNQDLYFIRIKEKVAEITLKQEINERIKQEFIKKTLALIAELKNVKFILEKEHAKEEKQEKIIKKQKDIRKKK